MEEMKIDSAWMWVSGCGVSKNLTKIKIQIKREDKKNWKNTELFELNLKRAAG